MHFGCPSLSQFYSFLLPHTFHKTTMWVAANRKRGAVVLICYHTYPILMVWVRQVAVISALTAISLWDSSQSQSLMTCSPAINMSPSSFMQSATFSVLVEKERPITTGLRAKLRGLRGHSFFSFAASRIWFSVCFLLIYISIVKWITCLVKKV